MSYKDGIYNFNVRRYNISSEDDILNDFSQNIQIVKDGNVVNKKVNLSSVNEDAKVINTSDDVVDPNTFFNSGYNSLKNIIK